MRTMSMRDVLCDAASPEQRSCTPIGSRKFHLVLATVAYHHGQRGVVDELAQLVGVAPPQGRQGHWNDAN
jgi:hypothetical protein